MTGFTQFYIRFLEQLWNNIVYFFTTVGDLFARIFWKDWAVDGYYQLFSESSATWNILDYVAFIFVLIVNIAFIGLFIFLLYLLLRRYVRFTAKEIDKDTMVEEVSLLNQKVVELIDEKNKILAMRVSQLGVGMPGMALDYDAPAVKKKDESGGSRFSKLILADKMAAENPIITSMTSSDMLSLEELIDRFINYAASQLRLYYKKEIIARWFAGLATSKVLILEGISGTGKTSLPYAMGKFFGRPTSIISVQPSWRDRAELIGYLNEFTKKFNETDFLKSVYEASYSDTVNLIVLDEMNLARIEYYFAEFLSVMEMPDVNEWKIEIVASSDENDPKNLINGKILIPQNLWFIGTANKDDSTFTITDKVYDRAVAIALNQRADLIDAPYTEPVQMTYEYLDDLFKKAQGGYDLSDTAAKAFAELDLFIQDKFKIAFGNRIMKQIKLFVPVYMDCGFSEFDGLDYMLTFKILRKFEMLNLAFLKKELDELIAKLDKLFGKEQFMVSKNYIEDLKKLG